MMPNSTAIWPCVSPASRSCLTRSRTLPFCAERRTAKAGDGVGRGYTPHPLRDGVMVARLVLAQVVQVRVLVPQLGASYGARFLFERSHRRTRRRTSA